MNCTDVTEDVNAAGCLLLLLMTITSLVIRMNRMVVTVTDSRRDIVNNSNSQTD